jgi:aminopeptidase N
MIGTVNATETGSWIVDPNLRDVVMPLHDPARVQSTFPSKTIDSVYDVRSYKLILDWYNALSMRANELPEQAFTGEISMWITMLADDQTELPLNAINIDPLVTQVNGKTVSPVVNGGRIRVPLPAGTRRGDMLQVVMEYACRNKRRGFYVYDPVEMKDRGFPEHPIAFTFNQPEDARYWFPCHDEPWDKATFETYVRVPDGITATANGTLKDVSPSGTGAVQFHWTCPDEMPSYLYSVNASIYEKKEQFYRSVTGDSIPIYNFLWPEDWVDDNYNGDDAFWRVPLMFEAFEDRFGVYPFDSYGHVAVAPISFGGMEHQTMTTINQVWVTRWSESGVAHEVGHQWLGDWVTCATWGDIWLNEGGASFSEAVFYEHIDGLNSYNARMEGQRRAYLRNGGYSEPPVWDIPLWNIFNGPTTYAKASWVYHMMRRMVGDDAFFPALKAWIQHPQPRAEQTVAFIEHWKQMVPNPPIPWDTFFDQWLIQLGHPTFEAKVWVQREDGYRTKLNIAQIQDLNIAPVFAVPLTVRLFSQGVQLAEWKTVMTTQQIDTSWDMPGFGMIVDSVAIDPEADLLKEVLPQIVVSVDDDEAPMTHTRTTIVAGEPLPVHHTADATEITVVDALGRLVMQQQLAPSTLTTLDTSTFGTGLHFVTVHGGSSTTTLKVLSTR